MKTYAYAQLTGTVLLMILWLAISVRMAMTGNVFVAICFAALTLITFGLMVKPIWKELKNYKN